MQHLSQQENGTNWVAPSVQEEEGVVGFVELPLDVLTVIVEFCGFWASKGLSVTCQQLWSHFRLCSVCIEIECTNGQPEFPCFPAELAELIPTHNITIRHLQVIGWSSSRSLRGAMVHCPDLPRLVSASFIRVCNSTMLSFLPPSVGPQRPQPLTVFDFYPRELNWPFDNLKQTSKGFRKFKLSRLEIRVSRDCVAHPPTDVSFELGGNIQVNTVTNTTNTSYGDKAKVVYYLPQIVTQNTFSRVVIPFLYLSDHRFRELHTTLSNKTVLSTPCVVIDKRYCPLIPFRPYQGSGLTSITQLHLVLYYRVFCVSELTAFVCLQYLKLSKAQKWWPDRTFVVWDAHLPTLSHVQLIDVQIGPVTGTGVSSKSVVRLNVQTEDMCMSTVARIFPQLETLEWDSGNLTFDFTPFQHLQKVYFSSHHSPCLTSIGLCTSLAVLSLSGFSVANTLDFTPIFLLKEHLNNLREIYIDPNQCKQHVKATGPSPHLAYIPLSASLVTAIHTNVYRFKRLQYLHIMFEDPWCWQGYLDKLNQVLEHPPRRLRVCFLGLPGQVPTRHMSQGLSVE